MREVEFVRVAKQIVTNYTNEHTDKTDDASCTMDDVYIVWQVRALQNYKALLSTALPDGMYYEVTYNGDKAEIYLDAYKKFENRAIVMPKEGTR